MSVSVRSHARDEDHHQAEKRKLHQLLVLKVQSLSDVGQAHLVRTWAVEPGAERLRTAPRRAPPSALRTSHKALAAKAPPSQQHTQGPLEHATSCHSTVLCVPPPAPGPTPLPSVHSLGHHLPHGTCWLPVSGGAAVQKLAGVGRSELPCLHSLGWEVGLGGCSAATLSVWTQRWVGVGPAPDPGVLEHAAASCPR